MEDALKQKLKELKGNKESLDVQAKVSQWRSDVTALLDDVVSWLGDLEESGLLTIRRRTVQVKESLAGSYETERLDVDTQSLKITIHPVGRWIVGCDGRVDVVSVMAPLRYMLLRFEGLGGTATWEIRDSRQHDKGEPLTKEALRRALLRMIEA